jgi:limonene 1,2-monooxygenase
VIASPEMFLAAAGEHTHQHPLGTGVISLPYHHPFNVAQRIVQLDHMTGGRVIFGSGPGALPSDAFVLGIDPMVQRDRQDEAIGVIKRLFAGERVTHESEWFTLRDARLQLFPLPGGHAVRRRLADQPVGHDAGRQVRRRACSRSARCRAPA